jgi:hypothetical protein
MQNIKRRHKQTIAYVVSQPLAAPVKEKLAYKVTVSGKYTLSRLR